MLNLQGGYPDGIIGHGCGNQERDQRMFNIRGVDDHYRGGPCRQPVSTPTQHSPELLCRRRLPPCPENIPPYRGQVPDDIPHTGTLETLAIP